MDKGDRMDKIVFKVFIWLVIGYVALCSLYGCKSTTLQVRNHDSYLMEHGYGRFER